MTLRKRWTPPQQPQQRLCMVKAKEEEEGGGRGGSGGLAKPQGKKIKFDDLKKRFEFLLYEFTLLFSFEKLKKVSAWEESHLIRSSKVESVSEVERPLVNRTVGSRAPPELLSKCY